MLSATVEIRECTLEGVDDGHTSTSDTSALIEKIDGKVEGEKEQEEEEEETKKTTTTMTTTTTRRKEWMETEKKMFDFDYPRPKNEGKSRKAVTSSIPVWPCLWCCCAPIGRMTICCVCRSRSEEVPDFICCVLGACWPVSMFWTSIIILVPGVIFLTLGSKLPLPVNIVGIAIQVRTIDQSIIAYLERFDPVPFFFAVSLTHTLSLIPSLAQTYSSSRSLHSAPSHSATPVSFLGTNYLQMGISRTGAGRKRKT